MTEQISLVDVSSSVSLKDELSSDDSDNDDEAVPNQNDFSQRRRVQNAQFEALLSKRADADSNEAIDRAPIALSDGELSIAHLVAKQDLGNGMLDPREYQIELFERAKTQNTIAVLDTGIAFKAGFQRFAPVI
jgi:endoribonuclease Dicer